MTDREKLQEMGAKWLQRIIAAEKREEEWRKDAEAAEKAYAGGGSQVEGKVYDFNILHSNVETIVPAIFNSQPVPDIRRRFADDDPVAKQTGDLIERAITVLIDDNKLDREVEKGAQDAFLSGRDIVRLRYNADWPEEDGEPDNERIEFEAVSWRDFRMGPARRWEHVGWVAFRHWISREEMERLTDDELLDAQRAPGEITLTSEEDDDIQVWEVWCKESRTVKFIRDSDRKVLKVEDDPLQLDGFFPIPGPVQPLTLTGKMTPICPFMIYRRLADELDLVTARIRRITATMKVRGVTYGDAADLERLARADDGEIVPATGLEQLIQTGGLDKAIAWWPIEVAAGVLQQLYLSREQIKQSIYEITGISDIVRGASEAQETATAQQIKTQWGSLRIQKMQRMIERQVRDIFMLMAEIIAKHFSDRTLYEMTGIEVAPEMRALLDHGPARNYRIDVESDSTVRADMTRMRGEMGEFLNGTGQFIGAIGPVIETRPEMAEPMAEVYAAFARQFRLGKSAEDALDRMSQTAKQAPPDKPDPKAQEMEAKAQEAQARMAMEEKKLAQDAQFKAAEMELEKARMAFDQQVKRDELNLKRADLEQQAEFKAADVAQQEAQRSAEGKRQQAQTNETLGLPPDFSFEDIVQTFQQVMTRQADRDAEQTAAIEKNADAISELAAIMAAPKEAVLSNGRRIRVERTDHGVMELKQARK